MFTKQLIKGSIATVILFVCLIVIFSGMLDVSFINQYSVDEIADFSVLLLIVFGVIGLGWARKKS